MAVYHLKCRIDGYSSLTLMFPESDYEQTQETLFSKGNFVFGTCDNQLPWPGKITKVYLEKSYGVKFIGHKSFAVLQESSILKFDEENINRVVIQYNVNDSHRLTKIIKAIELCKADLAKIARRKQRQSHAQKKQIKKAVEDDKNHKKHSKTIKNTQQKPHTRRQTKKQLKKNRQSSRKVDSSKKQDSKLSHIEYLPPNCENNEESIKSNKTISKMICEMQGSKSNQTPSSTPDSERQLHENWSRLCVIDESLQNSILSTEQTLPVPFYDRQQQYQQQQQKQQQQPQQQYVVLLDKPSQETSEELKMIPFLKHLISYVSKQLNEPLNKQQKKMFSELLQNNRRLQYQAQLLEHMVRFIIAFNKNHSEERKNCMIEYIKVKERVQTMLMLGQIIHYNENTNKILQFYKLS